MITTRIILTLSILTVLLLSCHPQRYAQLIVLASRDVGCLSFWTQGPRLDSLAATFHFPDSLESLPRFDISEPGIGRYPNPFAPTGIFVHPQLSDTFALLFLQRKDSLLVGSILQRCHLESPIFIPNDSIAHIIAPGDYILLAAHDGVIVARAHYLLLR